MNVAAASDAWSILEEHSSTMDRQRPACSIGRPLHRWTVFEVQGWPGSRAPAGKLHSSTASRCLRLLSSWRSWSQSKEASPSSSTRLSVVQKSVDHAPRRIGGGGAGACSSSFATSRDLEGTSCTQSKLVHPLKHKGARAGSLDVHQQSSNLRSAANSELAPWTHDAQPEKQESSVAHLHQQVPRRYIYSLACLPTTGSG